VTLNGPLSWMSVSLFIWGGYTKCG
jgi:hypothetical protein